MLAGMSELSRDKLRRDALAIWQAGVDAVRSDALVRENVHLADDQLDVAGERFDLRAIGRIAVVGAGKAGAGMAAGLEAALGEQVLADKHIAGWINVPADCVQQLSRVHLHAARPAGVNEPTAEGVAGAREIMRLVGELGPDDLCIALISGGGSALLPLPLEAITLEDKLAVTRFLSAAGAPIDELNTVRKQLSRIKGGGLARACGAGRLVTLVISDVLGDPLDLIASGPTVRRSCQPGRRARRFSIATGLAAAGISERVFAALAKPQQRPVVATACQVTNHVIGNNALAVAAAASAAQRLGYAPASVSATASEGAAEDVGRQLADAGDRDGPGRGPELPGKRRRTDRRLVEAGRRGTGGRNQQLVLAAVERLQAAGARDVLILSGGTDGEDGPTDAAGAWADWSVIEAAQAQALDPADYLARNDAYHWFEPLGALLKTGPTHTNVCDVRVVLAGRAAAPPAS